MQKKLKHWQALCLQFVGHVRKGLSTHLCRWNSVT